MNRLLGEPRKACPFPIQCSCGATTETACSRASDRVATRHAWPPCLGVTFADLAALCLSSPVLRELPGQGDPDESSMTEPDRHLAAERRRVIEELSVLYGQSRGAPASALSAGQTDGAPLAVVAHLDQALHAVTLATKQLWSSGPWVADEVRFAESQAAATCQGLDLDERLRRLPGGRATWRQRSRGVTSVPGRRQEAWAMSTGPHLPAGNRADPGLGISRLEFWSRLPLASGRAPSRPENQV